MKKVTLLFLLFSTICFSQFSKTHYIPPLSNSDAQEPQDQYIYISCPSITPISFQIQEIGGSTINGTVSRDTPYVYSIGSGFDTQLLISSGDVNTIKNNKGYIIQAQDLVYATIRLTSTPLRYQAGGLVAKGGAALGTQFRIGAFINTGVSSTTNNHYTFATILATENNTTISFNDIKPGVELINNASAGNTPSNIILNSGESFAIAVEGSLDANRDGLIGASITSDKPIAVNCGSFAGTNGDASNLDLGFDQIVSAERTGNEYIFIKGNGVDVTERPLLIANDNSTDIYLNGSTTPFATLNAGEYLALDGSNFSSNGNLYVRSSKNIFAYQGIGGSSSQANQNMHFLPPLSCQTPKVINNIPFINQVGNDPSFTGTVCIVTGAGATLDFIINGTNYSLAGLPNSITVNGPLTVTGNANYVTYTFEGLTGNISVFSTKEVYLSYYGSSGAATYGGFYSGFTFKPEIVFQQVNVSQSNCIPNVDLKVSDLSGFDIFQWYFNGNPITGANSSSYSPTQPGNYYVKATLSACGINLRSDDIPVSNCPTNMENDSANDNIDADNDNDGISNCDESYGNQNISLATTASGNIVIGNYSNSFTGTITTSTTSSATPFVGNSNGSFVTDIPAGKTNWVTYEMNFAQPISIGLEYVTSANASDLLNSNAEYIIKSEINKTITVLNPNNDLLIDTNYDGIFESGITKYSSFEVRFRLNSSTLAAGSGTFKFQSYLANSISFTHKNLSDALPNKSTFTLYAVCVPKDSDNDGIPDQLDTDSDNDSVPDFYESQGINFNSLSNADTNEDGIDNVFGNGLTPADSDNDGVPNYLDLDSDNDGIYDLNESGSNASDNNLNGIIDGNSFGTNGLSNNIETSTDNGILNFTVADTDSDGIFNYIELDSDNDTCPDVTEAGFTDANNDWLLGFNIPPTVNPINGIVTSGSGSGYTIPNGNYIITAPITITTNPQNFTACEFQTATFTVDSNPVNSYEWHVSTDNGVTWNIINNNITYSDATTNTLIITSVSPTMTGYKYRAFLNKNGNSCGKYSADAVLTTYALPSLTNPITLKQCDDDTDGISKFNLTEINSIISSNSANETFTYFSSFNGADTNDLNFKISDQINYISGNGSVWVRVENVNHCFNVAQINLIVSATNINSTTFHKTRVKCDDAITGVSTDTDGTSVFDFSSVTTDIQSLLPPPISNYTINYYANESDALSEINPITANIANYRNTVINQQDIYVRIDSNLDNACFGLGPFVTLTVEALPVANPVSTDKIIRHCDDDSDGIYSFNTSNLNSLVLNGQTNKTVTYYDSLGNLINPIPSFTVTNNQTIKVRVTNNVTLASDGPCYDENDIQFIVDVLPIANAINPSLLIKCDDATDPLNQDGKNTFDTSTFDATIKGSQTGMLLTYTLANGTVLTSLPNPFETTTQNVIATVTNPINTSCPATTTLSFIVNPIPMIDLNQNGLDNEIVCTNLPLQTVTLNAGIIDGTPTSTYTYVWKLNGIAIPNETNYNLITSKEGIYTVEVTNILYGCTSIRTIEVIASDIAHITNIEIADLTDDSNSVSIYVTGTGDYIYYLEDGNSPNQTSNVFENVAPGEHTLYIKDLNGCGITEQKINVLGAPKFFTPNGDGFNDYWNIGGINNRYYPKSTIHIFDRYGNLITKINALSKGWDGTINGIPATSDDYWYILELDNGRTTKGHFSLKR